MKDTIISETKSSLKLFPAKVINNTIAHKLTVRLTGSNDDDSQNMTIPNVSGVNPDVDEMVWVAYMYSLDNAFVLFTNKQMSGQAGGGDIPTKLSQLQNDVGFITSGDVPTESTVAGWGFTKNTGTYSKPSGGIPKSDLASAVQTSLGRADTALQSYTETDPVFSASPAAGITASDITKWNGLVVPKIVTGTTTITSSNKTVNFPSGSFTSPPIVLATYSTTDTVASGNWGQIKISQITSSSFKVAYGGSGSASYPISWMAMQS